MQTARAATLLASASSLDALAPLAAAAGVPGPPLPLGRAARATLGLADTLTDARVAAGPGALRALLGAARDDMPLRDAARLTATRLARHAPLPLWLVVLTHPTGGLALAAWSPAASAGSTPRIAALLADPRHLLASDADTLATLAAAATVDPHTPGGDALVHARWVDALGRESLTRRFYRHLEQTVAALADSCTGAPTTAAERTELALLYTSRLLFLAFLESRGWLDGDRAFLTRTFDRAIAAGGDYHRRALLPLFFGTLNTRESRRAPAARAFGRVPFLNGGLFAPAPLERRLRRARFGDPELGAVVGGLLARYRFTPREDAAAWSEAAVDPEMLGKAFESLMGARERHASGAFYTPQPLVERVTAAALAAALALGPDPVPQETVDAALAGHAPAPADAARLHTRLASLRLLDPACGSGAFLVHALERIATLLALCGDPRPASQLRRAVLTRSIFGVDINPTAVWLAELRLWLSVVIEGAETDPRRVPPLPNLDHNVRVGDSLGAADGRPLGMPLGAPAWGALTGADPALLWGGDPWARAGSPLARPRPDERLATLRARYARATGPRKHAAAQRLADEERRQAILAIDRTLHRLRSARRDLVAAARDRDLFGGRRGVTPTERLRLAELREECRDAAARRRALLRGGALPFGFPWHFADAGAAGGFDAIVGNPPWVRPHALPVDERTRLRLLYRSCAQAAWRDGARLANAGQGFGGQADLAAAFVERALALAAPGGAVALLVPAKLWHALAGGGLRRLLVDEAELLELEDWSDAPASFDAAVYPSLLVARRRGTAAADDASGMDATRVAVHRGGTTHHFLLPRRSLPLDASPGSPWLLLPPPARRAFDHLRAAGPPLATTGLARPTLGVKCGCNAAYLVQLVGPTDGDVARVRADGRVGTIERALLRPVLRGESLGRGSVGHDDGERILWPHASSGAPLAALPPHAARWLAPWRARLEARTDAAAGGPWWSLFRTGGADPSRPRVVWPDVARALRAVVLPAGDPAVPLNTCYVAPCADERDARALAALLASPPIAAWLAALAEPARGGYRRHIAWTVALVPVPRDWARARELLAPHAEHGADLGLVADAYALSARELEPLVRWTHDAVITPPASPCAR